MDRVQIIVVEVDQRRYFLVRWFALIQKELNLCLEGSLLCHLTHTTSCFDVLLAIEAPTIWAYSRYAEVNHRKNLEGMLKSLYYMSIAVVTL